MCHRQKTDKDNQKSKDNRKAKAVAPERQQNARRAFHTSMNGCTVSSKAEFDDVLHKMVELHAATVAQLQDMKKVCD